MSEKRDPKTVGEAFDVMVLASDSVHRTATYLRNVAIPFVGFLFVIVIILIGQVEIRDNKISRLEGTVASLQKSSAETRDAATKAQLAAESAQRSLDSAIANSQQQSQDSNSAINKIDKIYDAICVKRGEC